MHALSLLAVAGDLQSSIYFPSLKHLDAGWVEVFPASVTSMLTRCPAIEYLRVGVYVPVHAPTLLSLTIRGAITDEQMAATLEHCPSLQHLHLDDCRSLRCLHVSSSCMPSCCDSMS